MMAMFSGVIEDGSVATPLLLLLLLLLAAPRDLAAMVEEGSAGGVLCASCHGTLQHLQHVCNNKSAVAEFDNTKVEFS